MKKLALLVFVSVLALGCEKEEPQLTEEEFEKKDFLEKKINGYPISVFQVWIDFSQNYLVDITQSENLIFELIPEDRKLKVDVTNISEETSNTTTHLYKYSDMLDVNHFRMSDTIHGIVVILKESYTKE